MRTLSIAFFENYLNFETDKRFRIALCRFRTSSHSNDIQIGRYNNIDRINRLLCNNCTMHELEDEYHFSLVCPKYRHLRH
jgi:hypothetical protein